MIMLYYINNRMGSCLSDPTLTKAKRIPLNSSNPIQQIANQYSIEQLREKWDLQQFKILQGKVAALIKTQIDFKGFLQIFPKLLNFSQETQKRYFKLFAFEGNATISKRQLTQALTIIKKVEHTDHLAPLIFYVYTGDHKHILMTLEQFTQFEHENKAYAKNLQNIEDLGEEISMVKNSKFDLSQILAPNNDKKQQPISQSINNVHKTQQQLQNIDKKCINLAKFKEVFQNYNLQSYQILFSWNIVEDQRQLVSYIDKQGIKVQKDDKIYLVQYQWFLAWKKYVEYQYNINVIYKSQENYQSIISYKSVNLKTSRQPKIVNQSRKIQKPGQIKNFLLKYGKRDNELNPNMMENSNYICVKQQIWNRLVAIYNGGPSIQRIYNKIYYNIIVKVKVNAQGNFVNGSSKRIQSKQKPTVAEYATDKQKKHFCYYKYPGKKNWIKLKNLSASSEEVFTNLKTYLAFVPKNSQQQFIHQYNIEQKGDKKILRQRFKNYGNEINISIDGVLSRAQVVEIEDDERITIEFIDEKGQCKKQTIKYQTLQKINPQNILQESHINQFSGLDNIGNTCYMNAIIQCLIRTPFFGGYLEQRNEGEKKQKQQQLLIQQVFKIYKKSKANNHQSINTKSFKRVFQKHCPYFEGNAQHDAQEFLICLLTRLVEQIKTSKQQYGVKQVQSQKKSEQEKNMNKKVVKFFSGKTQAKTVCKKCKNQGIRTQSFFTYSVSLPEQPKVQFFYHYAPFIKESSNKQPVLIQFGISLDRKTTVEQFLQAVAKQRKLNKRKLALYSVFNNEILNTLGPSTYYKQISYYLHFNAKLFCYEVEHDDSPTYHDYQRKNLSDKSIKIQLRQRIYSQKNKEYKTIYHPFILQITSKTYWKDVCQSIKTLIEKLEWPQSQEILEDNSNFAGNSKIINISQIKISTNGVKHKVSLDMNNSQQKQKTLSQLNKPKRSTINETPSPGNKLRLTKSTYKIRVIKSDHLYENNCIFCKDQLIVNRKSRIRRLCKGCTFNEEKTLFEQADFRNISDNIIIVVDWSNMPQFQTAAKDPSYDKCMQQKQNRKDILSQLLKNNLQIREELELRCQKQSCKYDVAVRTQKISVYPNILLLHLKRFTYQDNMLVKLSNNVVYPEVLELQPNKKQRYELYGVVSHYGSGVGGHYLSFVKVSNKWYKCDDDRVTFCPQGQHIDPNAYILFYKKIEFQPSLVMLSF